jgi:hypothetical protein
MGHVASPNITIFALAKRLVVRESVTQKAGQNVMDTRDFRLWRISADLLNRACGIGRAPTGIGRNAQQVPARIVGVAEEDRNAVGS